MTRPARRPRARRQDGVEAELSWFARIGRAFGVAANSAGDLIVWIAREQTYLLGMAVIALVRATGTTVQTGQTGLKFSFGRAVGEKEPGFHLLIPFLQIVHKVPTRSRTMDLPAQRVTTRDGLVYYADANVVYRVVDVHKAVVEIDDLERGMQQMLSLSVQELLRTSRGLEFTRSDALDARLAAAMETRLAPWGVEIERAGFMSLRPSPETMRIVQLRQRVEERRRVLGHLTTGGVGMPCALPLLGEAPRVVTRREPVIARENLSRSRRRLRRVLAAASEEHEILRRQQRPLLRWLLRATDMRTPVGQSWAQKALKTTRRAVAVRRVGDTRDEE